MKDELILSDEKSVKIKYSPILWEVPVCCVSKVAFYVYLKRSVMPPPPLYKVWYMYSEINQ